MRDALQLLHARWPTSAVNLLHGLSIVQNFLVVNRASLQDIDPCESLALYPHDRPAGRAVVVCQVLARVTEACESAVGAGELFELRGRILLVICC
jgi:hypothetical protein